MRYLMDVISLDATLVRGSHGRPTDRAEDGPLFITSRAGAAAATGPWPRPTSRTCCSTTCSAPAAAGRRRAA